MSVPTCGFAVIYQWRLREDMEQQFKGAWELVTRGLRDKRGGLGSRLHRADDGFWVAYAQWPSRQAWQEAGRLESVASEASAVMAAAIAESREPILLEPVRDLLGGVQR